MNYTKIARFERFDQADIIVEYLSAQAGTRSVIDDDSACIHIYKNQNKENNYEILSSANTAGRIEIGDYILEAEDENGDGNGHFLIQDSNWEDKFTITPDWNKTTKSTNQQTTLEDKLKENDIEE